MVLHMHRLFIVDGLTVFWATRLAPSLTFLLSPLSGMVMPSWGPDAVEGEECPDFTKGANRDGHSIAFLRNRT
jgi:hypothetical protein